MSFIRVTAILLLVTSCGFGDSVEQKRAKLNALRQETSANLFRQRAECQAVAIEFSGDRMMVDNCMDTLRAMTEMAQNTIADIDRRMRELSE